MKKWFVLLLVSGSMLTACGTSTSKETQQTKTNESSTVESSSTKNLKQKGVAIELDDRSNDGALTPTEDSLTISGKTDPDFVVLMTFGKNDDTVTEWTKADEEGDFEYTFKGIDTKEESVLSLTTAVETPEGEENYQAQAKMEPVVNCIVLPYQKKEVTLTENQKKFAEIKIGDNGSTLEDVIALFGEPTKRQDTLMNDEVFLSNLSWQLNSKNPDIPAMTLTIKDNLVMKKNLSEMDQQTEISDADFAKVEVGATIDEVQELLGAPDSYSEQRLGSFQSGHMIWSFKKGEEIKMYSVMFSEGKITSKSDKVPNIP